MGYFLGVQGEPAAELSVPLASSSVVSSGEALVASAASASLAVSTEGEDAEVVSARGLEVVVQKPRAAWVDSVQLNSADPIDQHVAFSALIAKGRKSDLGPLVRGWEEHGGEVSWQRDALYAAWGRTDPVSAMSYLAETFPEDQEYVSRALLVLRSWAGHDAQQAYAWGIDQDPEYQEPLLAAVVEGAAASEPVFAMNLLEDLPESVLRAKASDAMVRNMIPNQQRALRDRIDSLPLGSFKDGLIRQAALHSAKADGRDAARWAESFDYPDHRALAVNAVAHEWAKTEPEQAVIWAQSLQEEQDRKRAVAKVLAQWALHDPSGAGEWLQNQDSLEGLDQAIVRYAYRFQQDDPETAVSWALAIQDERLRHQTMTNLAKVWKQASPDTMAKYFQ